jgi:hypothetical protein
MIASHGERTIALNILRVVFSFGKPRAELTERTSDARPGMIAVIQTLPHS